MNNFFNCRDNCRCEKAIQEIRKGLGDITKGLKCIEDGLKDIECCNFCDGQQKICEGFREERKGLCELKEGFADLHGCIGCEDECEIGYCIDHIENGIFNLSKDIREYMCGNQECAAKKICRDVEEIEDGVKDIYEILCKG